MILVEVPLAYGKEILKLKLKSKHLLGILKPNKVTVQQTPKFLISKSLKFPISTLKFEEIFHHREKTVIIVPDKTRQCGASIFLPILVDRLNSVGIEDQDIKIILATGSHSTHMSQEIEQIVGFEIFKRIKIIEHDCHNSDELAYLGVTKFGTAVYINRHVVNAERLIVTGTAVHHYFAGYGGGPKMINPGCAGYETITRNHAMTIDAETGNIHPKCRASVLVGNPVMEDIIDSMKFIRADFLLETILNENSEIIQVFSGDLFEAHQKACETVDSFYKIPIPKKADLVVVSCGGYSKDVNFIQAHKSIQNAFNAVKRGGVILILAECRDGIGSQTFLEWFNYSDDGALRKALRQKYKLNGTTALSLKMKTQAAKIIMISKLKKDLVENLGMLPASTLEEGWSLACSLLSEDFKCYVIPNGSLTLPFINENET
ncbi:MAG: nickel-dependent lactate racemase [bacterium]